MDEPPGSQWHFAFGALWAFGSSGNLDQDQIRRWQAVAQDEAKRLGASEDGEVFTATVAGHRPGEVVSEFLIDDQGLFPGLTVKAVRVCTEGIEFTWRYAPAQPWRAGEGSPFGQLPATWPLSELAITPPPPPPFHVVDEGGREYPEWGWELVGSFELWDGTSRFVPPDDLGRPHPSGPEAATLTMRLNNRSLTVSLGTQAD